MVRYAATIFLGAFLLFLIQPMIGKYILPWFGGGSGVWTACMVFFQSALLAGYAYAYLVVRRLTPTAQTWLHMALLLAAVGFLPTIPAETWKPQPEDDPVWRILLLLAATIGLPFVTLAATGPLLQAWFTRSHAWRSPYRLYALSNAGSLLALLLYPILVEPLLTRHAQAWAWCGGFGVYAVLCAYCAVTQLYRSAPAADAPPSAAATGSPSVGVVLLWLSLPACAVIMLLSVTSQLSDEVSPVPFLWVITLAVYLLTFIICFEWPRAHHRGFFMVAAAAAPWIVWWLVAGELPGIMAQFVAYLIVLFICCMVCHGELYRLRPHPSRLTAYYLSIAAGGAMGGLFVSLAAPGWFNSNTEFFLALFGAPCFAVVCFVRERYSSVRPGGDLAAGMALIIVIVVVAGLQIRARLAKLGRYDVVRTRNFYGGLTLRAEHDPGSGMTYRQLIHGRISHGGQLEGDDERIRRRPTTYFGPDSGIGLMLNHFPKDGSLRIGVVGLGVGTVATYAVAGDSYRFYEINPQVIQFAMEHFTYIGDARARGVEVQIVLGDARLTLEREPPQGFDVLFLDAFSGDALPTHLLTREAFIVYERHLAEDGVIVAQLSNIYLDLREVVHRLARDCGFEAVFIESPAHDAVVAVAQQALLTRNPRILNLSQVRRSAIPYTTSQAAPLWTDDYCSLWHVLR
jgi:hypothetical protein